MKNLKPTETIIGTNPMCFQTKEGDTVEGMTFYFSRRLNPTNGGQGVMAEKAFLSKVKLNALAVIPSVGDEVVVRYNRWGKVDDIEVVDVAMDN